MLFRLDAMTSSMRGVALFLLCQILLYHSANLATGIEMLSDRPLLVERSANLLSSTTNGAVGC